MPPQLEEVAFYYYFYKDDIYFFKLFISVHRFAYFAQIKPDIRVEKMKMQRLETESE